MTARRHAPRYALADLMTAGDVARLLRVSPQAVSMWQQRPATGFPPPVGKVGTVAVWHRAQVAAWAAWKAAPMA